MPWRAVNTIQSFKLYKNLFVIGRALCRFVQEEHFRGAPHTSKKQYNNNNVGKVRQELLWQEYGQ